MTAEEKRDRREARHELARNIKRYVTRRQGLFLTTAQIKATTKLLTDRYFAIEAQKPIEVA